MYLVLTALLALNVSAEIINAFFLVDKGLTKSKSAVETTNASIFEAIKKQAEAYEVYSPLAEKAKDATALSKEFVDYVQDLREELISEAGGLNNEGEPVRKKDKDIPTRLLVKEGKGEALRLLVLETRAKMLDLLEEDSVRQEMAASIPLNIQDVPESQNKSWSEYNFNQMPVAACLPMLRKFQNDARATETTILNYLLKETTYTDIWDNFTPVASPRNSYVIKGEPYEAEVFLSAFSSQTENIAIAINNRPVTVNDGKAKYVFNPSKIGKNSYKVDITVTNPLTEIRKTYSKTFEYEVGERSVAVSPTKMNVFYIGVKNPVDISAAGIKTKDLKVRISGGGGTISKVANGKYMVEVTETTRDCRLTISDGKDFSATKKFRVKRIPTPIAKLTEKSGGQMSKSEFKAQDGVRAHLEHFDFETRCKVRSFELARVPKNDNAYIVQNAGSNFNGRALEIKNAAKNGDKYYFSEIKAKCPGDSHLRTLNSMAFSIR